MAAEGSQRQTTSLAAPFELSCSSAAERGRRPQFPSQRVCQGQSLCSGLRGNPSAPGFERTRGTFGPSLGGPLGSLDQRPEHHRTNNPISRQGTYPRRRGLPLSYRPPWNRLGVVSPRIEFQDENLRGFIITRTSPRLPRWGVQSPRIKGPLKGLQGALVYRWCISLVGRSFPSVTDCITRLPGLPVVIGGCCG